MDFKWLYIFLNRWMGFCKGIFINVNVGSVIEVLNIKKKMGFEIFWIIYLRKEIKVKDKRVKYLV